MGRAALLLALGVAACSAADATIPASRVLPEPSLPGSAVTFAPVAELPRPTKAAPSAAPILPAPVVAPGPSLLERLPIVDPGRHRILTRSGFFDVDRDALSGTSQTDEELEAAIRTSPDWASLDELEVDAALTIKRDDGLLDVVYVRDEIEVRFREPVLTIRDRTKRKMLYWRRMARWSEPASRPDCAPPRTTATSVWITRDRTLLLLALGHSPFSCVCGEGSSSLRVVHLANPR